MLAKEDYEVLVADLTRGNLLPTSWIPPKEIRELRDLVRQRIFLVRQKTKIKNKIHAELIKRGIEYKRNIFTKAGRKWLHSLKSYSNTPFHFDFLLLHICYQEKF